MNATPVAAQSIVHAFQQEIIFTATAINDFGCALKETFNLKISKPDLQLNGTHFQIIKGSSVQLSASGASFYEWSPAGSLSNHLISSPLATPSETTEFTVVALDSLGCSAQGNLVVEVKEEAFIPTLFTPNGDNRNDNLRIYGLTYATDFYFAIYNREGSRLYETSSVSEATQSGWSGMVNGVAQPAGTYYWKVEGRVSKNDLQFNGKRNGAFLLVR
jgi:gliding motility-associated-like protein